MNVSREFALASAMHKRATRCIACFSALQRGSFCRKAARGESLVNRFSDTGSTPARSTNLITGRTPETIVVLPYGFVLVLPIESRL